MRHHTPGSFPTANVALPYSTLAELEAKGETVTLEQTGPSKARASWQGGDGPHALDFDTDDPASLPLATEPTRNSVSLDPGFLAALDDAARTSSRDAARYATNLIQLRGRDGTLVATDGRQLLLQGGFRFPWKDEQYLPALPVFGARELPRDVVVELSLTKERITLVVGPWLFDFGVQHQVRFPEVDRVVPDAKTALNRLRLDARDIEALTGRQPGLPGRDDPKRSVTLDLGKAVVVRSGPEEGAASEVILPHARWDGPALRVVVDRRYLLRALGLGFSEILIADALTPLLCKDSKRTYLWMPLSEDESVPAAPTPPADPVRAKGLATATHPETVKRTITMPTNEPRSNGEQRDGSADRGEPLDPVAEAEELRVQLQAALARTARKSLADQIDRLDTILDGLADALNESVADAVRDAIAQTTREAGHAAVTEVLSSPALLRAALEKHAPPGAEVSVPRPAPCPEPPTLKENVARIGTRLRGKVKQAATLAGKKLREVCAAARDACKKVVGIAANAPTIIKTLAKAAWAMRKPCVVAVGVGVLFGAACYLGGQVVSTIANGAGGAAITLSARTLPLKRLFRGGDR